MKVYAKREIRNTFGQILYIKGKCYDAEDIGKSHYVINCEILVNEYPIISEKELLRDFYTIDDQRDSQIDSIL